MSSIYDINVEAIDGKELKLEQWKGQVILVVNVASKCGFTPQYKGLEELQQKYGSKGLVVMGFPCNQFGAQEPGTNAEIAEFCDISFKVTFPMFGKVDVNGQNTHPLYSHLKSSAKGLLGSEAIKWNFTKFLVDKTGKVVKRYAPTDSPASISKDIEALL